MGTLVNPEIIYVTKSEYKEGWGFKSHVHEDYYQLITVMSGSCTIELDGRLTKMNEGWSVLVDKGLKHALYTGIDERTVVVDIKFLFESEEKLIEECVGIKHTDDEEFMRGMDLIANEAVHKSCMFKELIDARLLELLIRIFRKDKKDEDNNINERYSLRLAGIAAEVARYIEEHYEEDICLDEVAKALGYSKIYLCQCFKKQANMGIFAYLYNTRLRCAKKLLQDTDLTHEQIILKTGFKTVNHFGRYFKQFYGISPGKMRRQMRQIMDVPVLLSDGYDLRKDNREIKH